MSENGAVKKAPIVPKTFLRKCCKMSAVLARPLSWRPVIHFFKKETPMHATPDLICYKTMPVWTKNNIPPSILNKHNTKAICTAATLIFITIPRWVGLHPNANDVQRQPRPFSNAPPWRPYRAIAARRPSGTLPALGAPQRPPDACPLQSVAKTATMTPGTWHGHSAYRNPTPKAMTGTGQIANTGRRPCQRQNATTWTRRRHPFRETDRHGNPEQHDQTTVAAPGCGIPRRQRPAA